MTLALVLAGGGVAGIAWETGLLLGVQDESPLISSRLIGADMLLGTSAGSTVAAQIGSGARLEDLFARQVSETTDEIAPDVDIDELMALFEDAAGDPGVSVAERRRRIGQLALSAPTVPPEVRRAVIEKRLPSHQWPERPLKITAIDVANGERAIFDRSSGAGLVDAVAASCAVPAVWPPVTIGHRQFMDGGVGSHANVDAVADYETVVMLAPTAEPGGHHSAVALPTNLRSTAPGQPSASSPTMPRSRRSAATLWTQTAGRLRRLRGASRAVVQLPSWRLSSTHTGSVSPCGPDNSSPADRASAAAENGPVVTGEIFPRRAANLPADLLTRRFALARAASSQPHGVDGPIPDIDRATGLVSPHKLRGREPLN
jgi:NTE family protein